MRIGDQCVFIRYRGNLRSGTRVFEPGDVVVATDRTGDVSFIFQGVDSRGEVIPWLRDTLHSDEYVRLRYAPLIANLTIRGGRQGNSRGRDD